MHSNLQAHFLPSSTCYYAKNNKIFYIYTVWETYISQIIYELKDYCLYQTVYLSPELLVILFLKVWQFNFLWKKHWFISVKLPKTDKCQKMRGGKALNSSKKYLKCGKKSMEVRVRIPQKRFNCKWIVYLKLLFTSNRNFWKTQHCILMLFMQESTPNK